MDEIHYKVKHNGRIVSKAAYVVLGIDDDGHEDVLGIWIGENETSKFWLKVLTDLTNRGVERVDVFSVDGLPGFEQAIKATYPKSIVQRCIVHQIRSSTRYVSYKDSKLLMVDLKLVYKAVNEESAINYLDAFDEKWSSKYLTCVKSWRDNWHVISPFLHIMKALEK